MSHAIRRSCLALLVALSAVGANAQEATGGIPAVLNSLSLVQSKLATLQTSVNSPEVLNSLSLLQSNLAALQTSVTALASQSQTNVRYTPLAGRS
jgi:hypothetical protein